MITRVLFLVILANITYSQVLGIDIGTQYWKAGLISPGRSFVIV